MNAIESVLGYLTFKNIENRGFIKYGYFKKLITYILDIHHKDYYIRKIFLLLCKKGYFIKKETIQKSFKYKFNPNPEIQQKEEINNKREPITLIFN